VATRGVQFGKYWHPKTTQNILDTAITIFFVDHEAQSSV
jgi:hypothetical protein